ncbi:hypothetical protein ILUMI_04031 [Ignelater luminosus]|uniref:DDE-1 domain-containing protein n=1 Tax=Ignelater luminosus TaxID=2038154 RepID=A0A8K0DDK8_IGNLU|nr:hypothetical protein ILUMI_04031 [Ignelater luminosus]
MDNHEVHVCVDIIKLAKANGVILLTLPPHTSHRLQPLDRIVYGPLKKYYKDACRSWLLTNPGHRISIYEITELFGNAYPPAFSQTNIISGFRSTGIFPPNGNVFGEHEFVTDIGQPSQVRNNNAQDQAQPGFSHYNQEESQPLHRHHDQKIQENKMDITPHRIGEHRTPEKKLIVTPDMIEPFPKMVKKNRKRKSTTILTDTPLLKQLEEKSDRKDSKGVEKVKKQCFKIKKVGEEKKKKVEEQLK